MNGPLWRMVAAMATGLAAIAASLVVGAPAHATIVTDPNNASVQYADKTWNWDWFDSSSHGFVGAGDWQPNFQCAEYVARALAFEGLIPGLSANSPQSAFATYTASNGRVYHLWNVGSSGVPGLYNFLRDTGLGTWIGNTPTAARPGDVIFYYNTTDPNQRNDSTRVHTTLVVRAGTESEAQYDGHNAAELNGTYGSAGMRDIIHINRKAASYLTATVSVLENNTTNCPGTQQYFGATDLYGLPTNYTYSNGSHACVRVTFPPVTKSSTCDFWFYVPAGYGTAKVVFGYWVRNPSTGVTTKYYASVDEQPLEGWHKVFSAANVTDINFQDNNGQPQGDYLIGWGNGPSHGMRQSC
ncbi:hypothetical protein ACFFWC_25185 [Plantactinospora siamensis]|uniref:Amidase domain-containing protein n=1 Tax=Plantactinospora siamensis TaxID=555372 RepID=A0ABV6NX14_9ACTN